MSLPSLISGVVEGFYGKPWNARQRHQLFDWMREFGLNTYLYAPKDDLKHRARWRVLYDDAQTAELAALLRDCQRHQINFIYAIAPGVSLRYHSAEDRHLLHAKLRQLAELGVRHFALLFDDIPAELPAVDAPHFSSLAEAQSAVANELHGVFATQPCASSLLFCPTVYCGRMANDDIPGNAYLAGLGAGLDPAINILWTGPRIISETITAASLHELAGVLRRKPVLWDNLFANDYDSRRLYLGPYTGRSPETRSATLGTLCNLNCEFEANYVPLRTFADFQKTDAAWEPRRSFLDALREWHPQWNADGKPAVSLEELELFADCFYLPYESGPGANQWLDDLETLLKLPVPAWGPVQGRFEKTCDKLAAIIDHAVMINNRDLLHSVYRFLWDLKEESTLLRRYLQWRTENPDAAEPFSSPDFLPGIYRGGVIARAQAALPMNERGCFGPASRTPQTPGA